VDRSVDAAPARAPDANGNLLKGISMHQRRSPLIYVGAPLILAGALIGAISLVLGNGDESSWWSLMVTRQRVLLMLILLAGFAFALGGLFARPRWPCAIAAVLAGLAAGWFVGWNSYEIEGDDIGSMFAVLAAVVLLVGAVLNGLAAGGVGVDSAPRTTAAAGPVRTGGVAAPPGGWYRDPTTPGQLRYWDGSAWTDHVAPA
jgi:hypothetical protein